MIQLFFIVYGFNFYKVLIYKNLITFRLYDVIKYLPEISKDWNLTDITHSNENDFWAVGRDYKGEKGILMHFAK
jgi:hypothetical protein